MKPATAKPAEAPGPPPLLQLLDRPIAFHRCFVTLSGSVTAALMLSQAVYWQKRTKSPDGWWYKTLEEWTEETGLNRRETEAARIKLRALDVLEEKRTGSPAKLWYRIDLNALEHALHGAAQRVTVAEILAADRRNLVQIAKAGLMRARRAGIAAEYVDYAEVLQVKGLICHVCRQPITQGLGKQAEALTIDYLIPLAQGGTHTPDNLHPRHVKCQGDEGAPDGLRKSHQFAYAKQTRLLTLSKLDCLPKANKFAYAKQTAPFYTETTTETTATTPDPVATPVPAPVPEPEGGGGGFDLIFDFELANLTSEQRERALKTLEGLTPEIAQQVLDEWNHAHACQSIKQSRWGWLRKVADAARSGQFIPSAELADRRQVHAQARAIHAQPPERQPSPVWRERREQLRGAVTDLDYGVYIAPLYGKEDAQALWLEAPNRLVAEWVNGHLPLIEGTLRPHTELPVRVCIG